MNRIIIHPEELEDDCVVLRDERARHIRTVLRAETGQKIRVGLLNGPKGTATVKMDDKKIQLTCCFDDCTPRPPAVDLLLAMPRPKVMKRLWAPLASMGVRNIYITNAEKVERNYFATHVLNESFIRARLVEGLQQSGDTILPVVSIHRRLKVFLEDELDQLATKSCRLIAHPRGGIRIQKAIAASESRRALIAVGPEGGWSEYEQELFQEHGFVPVSIGSRSLRTDTACIALLTLIHDAVIEGHGS